MEHEQIKMVQIIVNISELATGVTADVDESSVYSHRLDIGTKTMDAGVADYFNRRRGLLIGEKTAEAIRITIGSAFPEEKSLAMDVRGRDLGSNVPRTIAVTEEQISQAIAEVIKVIVDGIRAALEKIPKEAQEALENHGIILKGSGTGLRNLDKRVRMETKLPVVISNQTPGE